MKRFYFALWSLVLLSQTAVAADPAPLPESTPWDLEQLNEVPRFQWLNQQGAVHALKYQGEDYKGKPTSVFAHYVSPRTLGIETGEKEFPGIVLVHGGGGTAFSRWARIWANRGYAAIAMDLAGKREDRQPLEDGGPDQSHHAKFSTIDGPLQDQWSYHAVANVIRGHSLLRSFSEVNEQKIALTGISWGGYLTCIVAGLDQRFKVAMPVYGCGFLKDNSAWVASEFSKMNPAQVTKWHKLWDPSMYIGSATMPIMFLNGTNDFAYPLDSYARTCALVTGEKNYSIQLRMPHGHIFDFPEFFIFIDQYIKGGEPMPVVARPEIRDGKITATVKSSTKLVKAQLHYTTGPHIKNGDRKWVTVPLAIEGSTIRGPAAPDNTTAWYVDVTDERRVLVSSSVMIK